MANEIQELLKEIKDERLKSSRLSAAVAELRKTKKFGLVFEEHLPELLPIYSAKVRSQARVAPWEKLRFVLSRIGGCDRYEQKWVARLGNTRAWK